MWLWAPARGARLQQPVSAGARAPRPAGEAPSHWPDASIKGGQRRPARADSVHHSWRRRWVGGPFPLGPGTTLADLGARGWRGAETGLPSREGSAGEELGLGSRSCALESLLFSWPFGFQRVTVNSPWKLSCSWRGGQRLELNFLTQ